MCCDFSRKDFEKEGENFDVHLLQHSIWDYVYYLMYLGDKGEDEFDGVELEVWSLF
jgi:hypothetical protein